VANLIRITAGSVSLNASLRENETATAILNALPIEGQVNRWGDEIYFTIPVQLPESDDAREVVNLPGASEGKFFNFISRACPPDSSRGDSKEKANRGLTQPYAGLASPFPPAASSGVPWLFPMERRVRLLAHGIRLLHLLRTDPR